MKKRGGQLKYKVKIKWSSNFAYAIGLLTSDGYLHKDGRHLGFVSKDLELAQNFKKALNLSNEIGKAARGGEITKKYFIVRFGDKNFHQYLNTIGLTSAKSKTIQHVAVPKKYFADFLRGLYEGDGSFWTFWDKRWPNSFGYKLTFASASKNFIEWLEISLRKFYGVKGYMHNGKGVFEIRYVKGTSIKLFETMYYKPNLLLLKRKYDKIKNAIIFDKHNKK